MFTDLCGCKVIEFRRVQDLGCYYSYFDSYLYLYRQLCFYLYVYLYLINSNKFLAIMLAASTNANSKTGN